VATNGAFDPNQWWQVFHDPLLDSLVRDAAAQNLDVQTAALRIASARAQREAAGGAAYPQVAGDGVAGRTRMSKNGIAGALGGAGGSSGGNGSSSSSSSPSLTTNLYQVGFDATWELDLWGKVRRNVEATDADIVSAEEARRDSLASLTAEIARTYLGLRGAEQQIAILRADLATQKRLGELVASRKAAGLGAQSEVEQQTTQTQLTISQLPPLEQNASDARSRLALLLALPPGALDDRLQRAPDAAAAPAALPPELPIGLPGDLLRRRPDVRRSEADLHAATAREGVATAKLFPSITLGLAGGLQASRASDLTDWASRFFLGGVALQLPIFQGGQLQAQVKLADLDEQRAALAYRQAVLSAYHDADRALVAYGQEQRRSASYQAQLASAERSRALALSRWRDGLAAYTEVLDSERSAHQAAMQLAMSSTTARTDLVALFKALGGGWDEAGANVAGVSASGAR
jgi:NodT family efflux transporter outer membrane factor (OMF) lipoprotein